MPVLFHYAPAIFKKKAFVISRIHVCSAIISWTPQGVHYSKNWAIIIPFFRNCSSKRQTTTRCAISQ